MPIPPSLLALFLATGAHADTLVIQKNSSYNIYAWVDGQPQGRIKGKRQIQIELAPGPHEVWITADEAGTVTTCHGLVTVAGSTLIAARDAACDGLTPGYPTQGSFLRGALATLSIEREQTTWLQVNDEPVVALDAGSVELNLLPGAHTIALFEDEAMTRPVAEGQLEIAAGLRVPIHCGSEGCEGWGATPAAIEADLATP
jgi:hypothetical protein